MRFAHWLEAARIAAVGRTIDRAAAGRSRPAIHAAEPLEQRILYSMAALPLATPPIDILRPVALLGNQPNTLTPGIAAPFRPSDIQKAYGVDQISFDGTAGNGAGQTIAIIDAYNDPSIVSDVGTFSSQFGLPQFNGTGGPTFAVLNENGQSGSLPANASPSTGAWDSEEALDVEWAHAIAPRANIILFEANSSGDGDLYTAVTTAASYAGVSVVSMSFGSSEFSFEHSYDSYFTTPAGHQGVTFLASTGDNNAPGEYPAYSPNVVAVGGTSLSLNSDSSYASESAWGNVGTNSGGGGGVSAYETQPSYQSGNVNGLGGSPAYRTAPDVSMLADLSTGVYLYSTWNEGANNGGYYQAGGTSLACPMWAGLIAIADQDRVAAGLTTLNGPSQTLPRLYQLPSSDFHDITTGNNGFAAGPGYDLATGIGTPIANLLVPQLAGVSSAASKLAFAVSPSNSTAGAGISPGITIDVEDSSGNIVSSDSSTVTLTLSGGTFSTGSNVVSAAAVNGVATFSNLVIDSAGTYAIVASDGSLSGVGSGSFTVAWATPIVTVGDAGGTYNGSSFGATDASAIDPASSAVIATFGSGTLSFSYYAGTLTSALQVAAASPLSGAPVSAGAYTVVANYAGSSNYGESSSAPANFSIAPRLLHVSAWAWSKEYDGTTAATVDLVDDRVSGDVLTLGDASAVFASRNVGSAVVVNVAGITLGGSGASNYTLANTTASTAAAITPRSLTAQITVASRMYDGTNLATITGQSLIGVIAGDDVSLVGGMATFPAKDVATAMVTVTGLSLAGADSGNYMLMNPTTTASASITPRPVNGSISAASKVFDGTASASLSGQSLTGVLPGDIVNLGGGTATFDSMNVGTDKTVAAIGLALAGPQAGDYTLSNPSETATANILPMGISGTIFNDANADGTMDGGEAGIGGRTVYLLIAGKGTKGEKIVKTDAQGNFSFVNLAAGSYVVKVAPTTGWRFTNSASGVSPVSLQLGHSISGLNLGETNASTIYGRVFLNAAAKPKSLQAGLAGWTIELDGLANGAQFTATTDAYGFYTFIAVPTGVYRMSVVQTAGYTITKKANSSLSISLGASRTLANENFGEQLITAGAKREDKARFRFQ